MDTERQRSMSYAHQRAARLTMAALLLLPFGPLAAASDDNFVEISLVGGYQLGGSFDIALDGNSVRRVDFHDAANYGLFVDFRVQKNGTVGGMFIRMETELDTDPLAGSGEIDTRLDFYHFQGAYEFNDRDYTGYVTASLGITRFDVDGFDHDSRFSVTLGGGFRWFPWNHVGVRIEGRYYGTLVNSDSAGICEGIDDGQTVCLIYVDATVLSQWDAKAGLIIAF